MTFFNKHRLVRVGPLKVATTIITSSYYDGSGAGARRVKWYFIVREVNGKYYDVFSNSQILKESDTHNHGSTIKKFDTPYIEELEPVTKYLRNPNKKFITSQCLFEFIIHMNAQQILLALDKNKN